MGVLKKEEIYSLEDIYALPEGERAELVDGVIYYMAPPSMGHQRLVSEMHYLIKDYIKKNKGKCEVFPAPFAVFLDNSDKTYVEPDLCVICDPIKLDDRGCHGAPDWVIEVVSQSSLRWIILENFLSTAQQGSGNIGWLTRRKKEWWYIILRRIL